MAAAINLALAVTAFSWPSNPEPVYKGKKLSEWLTLHSHSRFSKWLQTGGAADRPMLRAEDYQEVQAVDAVRTIGSNALPCLLRWVSYETPRWRTWANRVNAKFPSIVQNSRLSRWVCDESEAEKRADLAIEGFYILGPQALPAINELTRIDKAAKPGKIRTFSRNGPRGYSRAWMAMVYIGKRLPKHDDVAESKIFKEAVGDRPAEFWFLQN